MNLQCVAIETITKSSITESNLVHKSNFIVPLQLF